MSTIQSSSGYKWREAGMVSIMVTMVLMIVVSLIVLGFAQISRRNQRQALDRQLSTQAFYAAESGINDAVKAIKDTLALGGSIEPKSDCTVPSNAPYDHLVPEIGPGVSYTCLLVDPTPEIIKYDKIGTRGTVVPITSDGPQVASFTFTWRADQGADMSGCPTSHANANLKPSGSWNCGFAVLRVDAVPVDGYALNVDTLQERARTTFLTPYIWNGTSILPAQQSFDNSRIGVPCSNKECSYTVSVVYPSTRYFLRVSSVYEEGLSVDIVAKDSDGHALNVVDTQVVIDVTGKAQDVLRRVQVRMPLSGSSSNMLSDFGLQSTEPLCKRFVVMGGYFSNDADDQVSGVSSAATNPNSPCKPGPLD